MQSMDGENFGFGEWVRCLDLYHAISLNCISHNSIYNTRDTIFGLRLLHKLIALTVKKIKD
jgi:hypothetical protein